MKDACLGLFRLPGDIHLSGKGWSFSFPIVTCLLLSALLTLTIIPPSGDGR